MLTVEGYLKKQKLEKRQICEFLREVILKTFPGIKEEMRWGVPVYGGGLFYIGALKDHVNLGFSIKRLNKEELSQFEGGGKTMRHIKVSSLKGIDQNKIVELLKLVETKEKGRDKVKIC
jgi:hypothetical protein